MASLLGDPSIEVLQLPVLGRLLLATLCGMVIGLEREMSGKPAGLRTNILICVGAALFTELSLHAATFTPNELVRADPARIAAQVVSALGFVGAGTILVSRGHVRGLTTAATMWAVASLGMAVGVRMYVVAAGGTVLVVTTLYVLGWFEANVLEERAEFTLRLQVEVQAGVEHVEDRIDSMGYEIRRLGHDLENGTTEYTYRTRGPAGGRDELLCALEDVVGVRAAQVVG